MVQQNQENGGRNWQVVIDRHFLDWLSTYTSTTSLSCLPTTVYDNLHTLGQHQQYLIVVFGGGGDDDEIF